MRLYEIGEGINMLRVRAQDAGTELYDLVPVEVKWVRDATRPQLQWKWTPEEVRGRLYHSTPVVVCPFSFDRGAMLASCRSFVRAFCFFFLG